MQQFTLTLHMQRNKPRIERIKRIEFVKFVKFVAYSVYSAIAGTQLYDSYLWRRQTSNP